MSQDPNFSRSQVIVRLALLGASLGLVAGVIEAAMLYFTPRVPTLHESELGWVIWPLAALLDLGLFALLGAILGCLAGTLPKPSNAKTAAAVAVLVGLVGSFLAWSVSLVHIWAGDLEAQKELAAPAAGFGLTFLAVVYILRVTWRRTHIAFDPATPWPVGRAAMALGGMVLGLALALVWNGLGESLLHPVRASESASSGRPNIILVVLDTVRADHFSSYGYSRPTTPNLDRLAQQGVLFENAIAPSSWTLPSHASIFTGLLPHQHGANTSHPLQGQPRTLAEILTASGYETANFFANGFGVRAWGLDQGFQTQDDLRSFLPHNLGSTLVGRVFIQPLWMTVAFPDSYFRRRAPDINSDTLRWFERRSQRPFFLFINYLDPHDPHVAPRPFRNRHGEILPDVVRRVTFGNGAPIDPPFTDEEQASAIGGYDNCLSYVDDQFGRLLAALSATPEWKNTVVIVTSDHGEAFGEHGLYLHNRSLYFREAIHVPLIVTGPGVPAGLRIPSVVPIREIFSTVLDFALANPVPFRSASLRRFWTPGFKVDPAQNHAVSELVPFLPNFRPVMISLMVEDWHYIRRSDSTAELYHWKSDPFERIDLARSPGHQQILRRLDERLKMLVGGSTRPWWEPEYLLALDGPRSSFANDVFQGRGLIASGDSPPPIGASQAFFDPDQHSMPRRRAGGDDEDLVRSLPYR